MVNVNRRDMCVHRLQIQRGERGEIEIHIKGLCALCLIGLPTISSAYIQLNMQQHLLLYDLKGSRRYTEIAELTHRLRTHRRRLIHEFLLATGSATGICNCELPLTYIEFQAFMYIKTEFLS